MKRKKKSGNPKVEECDIWLDTRELKRKKVESHSISKLLNPLSRRNHTAEVALNFTQTRAPQQCIKQTTVSSFFFPKAKGKLADPTRISILSAVGAASPNSVTEKETYTDQPELITDNDFCRDNFGYSTPVGHEERLPSILRAVHCSSEERVPLCGTTHGNTTHILNKQAHQMFKEREHSCLKGGANINIVEYELPSAHGTAGVTCASVATPSEPPDDFTQLDFTQDSQGNRVISHRKVTRSPAMNYTSYKGMPVPDGKSTDLPAAASEILSMQSFETGLLGKLTSTQQNVNRQKLSKRQEVAHLPKKLNSDCFRDVFSENKENVFGPMLNFNLASLERPSLSPGANSFLHHWNVPQGTEVFQQPKTACSDQSVLSLLFSQDSQGNRVISHRRTDSRHGVVITNNRNLPLGVNGGICYNVPLKEKLHHSGLWCESSSIAQLKYDDTVCPQADLLFTQDSEGYAVIKHC
ncbi:uncharacterized protein LOC122544281 isoform X2 [Chiloscyllium plagiosum]|uniref:uncharacterized protein LOC122544281 isoform X2 n=1 Tax=Chiloscyllium plagiosum TaxID=36176 RepID=UPI001CB83018|nr:uncharacterized protein LOC122544281 isoform X2 [Chiloscyllium plagiosum]